LVILTVPLIGCVRGFQVRVNVVEDGDVPHVHVRKGGREYRVALLAGGAELLTMGGYERTTRAEARVAVRIVKANLFACWREWRRWRRQDDEW
jgi:hypothetical protein